MFRTVKTLLVISAAIAPSRLPANDSFGTLIFEDSFERSESQELKDEPGNEWTTSSDKTAQGHKQVDLRDGEMFIYTHAVANHATSVRHAFAFTDGTVALRFKLDSPADSLTLNFADLKLKSVHAGHLFKVVLKPTSVEIVDQKTGEMDLTLRKARQAGSLTAEQSQHLKTTRKRITQSIPVEQWHDVAVTITGDQLTVRLNDHKIGSHTSPGFAHETKTLLRLLAAHYAHIDDVRIWRQR